MPEDNVSVELSALQENPTLGQASNSAFLDEIEAQVAENQRAQAENRSPMVVERRERFGVETLAPISFVSQEDGAIPETDAVSEADAIKEETDAVIREQNPLPPVEPVDPDLLDLIDSTESDDDDDDEEDEPDF